MPYNPILLPLRLLSTMMSKLKLFKLVYWVIWMSRENYDLTGQKMQGYTISKPIGQGKFSIVYRA